MLSPRERALLLQSLRPPHGFRLDRAIGTSYSLDLLALLTTPLAFAFYDWEDAEGRPLENPIALLHALRGYARRIHLFCQAGQIQAPVRQQPLFAYLEPSVIEAAAPRKGGVFHPKCWILRFTASDEPVRYRVLVASRNLTFDRSWDTLLALDGELTTRKNAFANLHPLGNFVAALPELAVRAVTADVRAAIERISSEIRRVRFELPPGFTKLHFHPLGIRGYEKHWPLAGGGRKCLIVSPFASDKLLRYVADECLGSCHGPKDLAIVSRPETLAGLETRTLQPFSRRFVLAAEAEGEEGEEDLTVAADTDAVEAADRERLTGLHAKLFILHRHKSAHVFTGSANATDAAFERNVELLVELVGGYQRQGIEALLGTEQDGGKATLRELLEPWEPSSTEPDPEEHIRAKLRFALSKVRLALGRADLSLRVQPEDSEGLHDVVLRGRPPRMPEGVRLRTWPASRRSDHAVELGRSRDERARFLKMAPIELTSFCAFELVVSDGGIVERALLARNLPIEGLPDDREERLLRELLKDRDTVLRLLWILLSSEDPTVDGLVEGVGAGAGFAPGVGLGGFPLLEVLVRVLARDPTALDPIRRLIEDLSRSEEGRALLPDGLQAIWEPVSAVRGDVDR